MSSESIGPLEISCQDVHDLLSRGEPFRFLDCREQDEYDTVHIEGATLFPLSEAQERVAELDDPNEAIVIHCHHGGRSLRLANWLHANGFTDVKSMAGGIDRWAIEIDPEKPRY